MEQKNYSIVRRTVGYYRYDTPDELALLEALYRVLRLYANFFQPVMKLKEKVRVGSRLTRRYDEPQTWDLVRDIPSGELWEAHKRRKRRLISFVRERVTASAAARKASAAEVRRLGEVLDPDAFTIGFARRFATYKRATLLFRDVRRLKKILTNPDMPVQIVIAGKAHPKDHPGKSLIREIVQLSRDPEINRRLTAAEVARTRELAKKAGLRNLV